MEKVSICLIEDQLQFASYTKDLIMKHYEDVSIDIYHEYSDELNLSYDIYILDIELGEQNGFDIAQSIRNKQNASIIFLTSHDELARKGYRYQAAGFVSKDEVDVELLFVLDRLITQLRNEHVLEIASYRREREVVCLRDVIYAVGAGHYCEVYTMDDCHKVRISLNKLKEKDERMFYPCNRSTVINMAYVRSIVDDQVYLANGDQCAISRRNEKKLKDAYKLYCLHAV